MKKEVLVCLLVVAVVGICLAGRINRLPGLGVQPNFSQYSGYITVNQNAGRALFYWFSESQRNPSSDPVVLWLTGGPGCSSLMALLSENGPFRPNTDGNTLFYNPYSWNTVANVIWLESPAGVGFSYSNTTSDYTTVGDLRTKIDTYNFLSEFFNQFPQFRNNPLWVTGESYGGHYVPEITQYVWQQNKIITNKKINIKGMMVGNAWTYMPIDNLGAITTWWQRFIVPEYQTKEILKACNLSEVGPLLKSGLDASGSSKWVKSAECDNIINKVMEIFNDIDIYGIYADVCHASSTFQMMKQFGKAFLLGGHNSFLTEKPHLNKKKRDIPFDACVDGHLTNYLNLKEVQEAINAKPTNWGECSSVVQYNYSDIEASVLPIYRDMMDHSDLSILVYSGDVDGIVPTVGTRIWTTGLGRKRIADWRPWMDANDQVGGFVEVYDRFTFATVREAGHMCPYYQPQRSWVMFSQFLEHQKLQ